MKRSTEKSPLVGPESMRETADAKKLKSTSSTFQAKAHLYSLEYKETLDQL